MFDGPFVIPHFRFVAAFLCRPPDFRFDGTFAPFLRASERPMAIACFLLVTFPPFPPLPLRSVPFLRFLIALSTCLLTASPYVRPLDFLRVLFFRVAMCDHSRSCWLTCEWSCVQSGHALRSGAKLKPRTPSPTMSARLAVHPASAMSAVRILRNTTGHSTRVSRFFALSERIRRDARVREVVLE